MTRKLFVLKRNLVIHRQQREAARRKSWTPTPPESSDDYIDRIMQPPQELVNLYCMELEVYARENIMGITTLTLAQQQAMLQRFLDECYQRVQCSSALGMTNRQTYWKPRVDLVCDVFEVYLGKLLISRIS